MRTPSPGFSLVELLLATLLGAICLMGLGAIFFAAFRFQADGYKRDVVQDGAVASVKAVKRDLAKATFLSSPAAPCPNADCSAGGAGDKWSAGLEGCTNYDPRALANPLDARQPMRSFWYCVAAGNDMYYKWVQGADGVDIGCGAARTGACDASPPPGGGAMLVARAVGYDLPDFGGGFFKRPAGANDVVELHYVTGGTGQGGVVVKSTMSYVVSTAMVIEAALLSAAP